MGSLNGAAEYILKFLWDMHTINLPDIEADVWTSSPFNVHVHVHVYVYVRTVPPAPCANSARAHELHDMAIWGRGAVEHA